MMRKKLILTGIAAFLFVASNAQSGGAPVSTYTYTGKPQYQIKTTRAGVFLGNINVELFPSIAPNHVKNFDTLVSTVFYDTTAFHRVIPGFVIQGGDPNSRHGAKSTWGMGQPGQPTVNAEFSVAPHKRGTFAAARAANINSATSQFYICVAPQPSLDNNYTVYGRVTSGMNIVDTIVLEPRDANDCPYDKIEMFVTFIGSNDTLATVPALNTPLDGAQNVGVSKQLKWFSHGDDVIYQLEVSIDSLFSTFFKQVKVGVTYNTVVGLQDSTIYYWRVKANNGGNWSGYSPVWHFYTTGLMSVDDLSFIEKGYRLDQNIPNPSTGKTSIKYAVPGKERVRITLFDIAGKEISILVDEEKMKGEYEVTLDMNKYSAGTYFYTMQAGEMWDSKKIIYNK